MANEVIALEVSLHDTAVGVIHARGDSTRFFFYESYIHSADRNVLGLRFEEDIERDVTGQGRLPSWFTNVLPEGVLENLVQAQLQSDRGDIANEIEMLDRLGSDLPGAVTVHRTDQVAERARDRRPISLTSPTADRPKRDDDEDQQLRFSIAGVGMKFSMLRSGERFTAPAHGLGGDWIVKLPDRKFEDLPINEFAMMTLASRVGIQVPSISLVHRDLVAGVPDFVWGAERQAYAIRRFDRGPTGRVHIEDLAQVRGYYPERKYTGTFDTIGSLFFRGHDTDSAIEFIRRLALSVVIGNGDAHLKNWSLIYLDGRRPTIAPAYDIVSVAAYRGHGLANDLGLKLRNSKRYESVTLESFTRLGTRLGVQGTDFGEVARQVINDVTTHWPEVETNLRLSPEVYRGVEAHFEVMRRQLLSVS